MKKTNEKNQMWKEYKDQCMQNYEQKEKETH